MERAEKKAEGTRVGQVERVPARERAGSRIQRGGVVKRGARARVRMMLPIVGEVHPRVATGME